MRAKIIKGAYDTHFCYVCPKIFDTLNLVNKSKYTLHVGHFKETLTFKVKKKRTGSISLPSSIFKQLLLIDGMVLNIRKENRDIYFGPVVGIFVNTRKITN